MYCKKCGQKNADTAKFCRQCGAELKVSGENENSASRENENNANATVNFGQKEDYMPYVSSDMIPEEYKPISMWGYLGYEILFSLPIVGLVLLIVFSVGGTKNRNLKNFARSYFCFLLIVILLIILILFLFGVLAGGVSSAAYFEGLI